MTELQMRLRASSVAYAVAMSFAFFLAIQNFRYGLYPLVYTAMLLIPLYGFGVVYIFAHPLTKFHDKINISILCVAALLILFQFKSQGFSAQQWIYPVGLLSYLVLSVQSANLFNAVLLTLSSGLIAIYSGFFAAMLFLTSYLLLCFISGMYAHLHHHRSRSLVALSIHDELTGAYNMRYFYETLEKEISRTGSTHHPLSLVIVDIDYFDQVNRLHSQNTINLITQQLSAMLNKIIRAGDSHYHQAEGRFFLLLPDTPAEGVLVIAERIRRHAIDSQFPSVEAITLSLGCTTFLPENGSNKQTESPSSLRKQLLLNLDAALQESHRNGHNRVSQIAS
jgi:diguanylate cyclase (GGDEF)-like protein